jgi:hypothetical protein
MFDPRKHDYFKKLLELYHQGKIRAPDLIEVDVYHDDWCGVYRGQYCNCDPDIELRGYSDHDPRCN